MNSISVGVFGTFGSPNGFQQYFYFDAVFRKSLDLNPNAIQIYSGPELFSIKKDVYNGIYSICCSIYTYAKEKNSSRGGTFIGSCVILQEAYVDSVDIYNLLIELHKDTINNEKNILNSIIQVSEAVKIEVTQPLSFEKVKSRIQHIETPDYYSFNINSNKTLFISGADSHHSQENQIIKFIENSIKHFPDTDTLYFTFNDEIIDYVNKKKLLKIANWGTFISYAQEAVRQREREQEAVRQREREQEAVRQREREQEAVRQREREQEVVRQREREQEVVRQREREQEVVRQREREQEAVRQREREQEAVRQREREQEAVRQREREAFSKIEREQGTSISSDDSSDTQINNEQIEDEQNVLNAYKSIADICMQNNKLLKIILAVLLLVLILATHLIAINYLDKKIPSKEVNPPTKSSQESKGNQTDGVGKSKSEKKHLPTGERQ